MTMTLEQVYDASRRDLKSLRDDLVTSSEEASRQTLAAHKRALAVLDENERNARVHRQEVRDFMVEQKVFNTKALKHLEKLVVIPASERETMPEEEPTLVSRLAELFGTSRSTTRLMLAATVAAVLASTLTACGLSVAHAAAPTAQTPPVQAGGIYP